MIKFLLVNLFLRVGSLFKSFFSIFNRFFFEIPKKSLCRIQSSKTFFSSKSISIKIIFKMGKREFKIEDPFEDRIQNRDTGKKYFYMGLWLGFLICLVLLCCIGELQRSQNHYKPANRTFDTWLTDWMEQYAESRDEAFNPKKWHQRIDKGEKKTPLLIQVALFALWVASMFALYFCARTFWEIMKVTYKDCKESKRAKNRQRLYKPPEDQV